MTKETATQEWTSEYNPFNSQKLLSQLDRWKGIKDWKEGNGELPAPTTVSVDPANVCNIYCKGCNADFLMQRNSNVLSRKTLGEIADFLPTWGTAPYNVKGVCIGGGGESLLNPHTGEFIQKLKENGIKSGVVTNGTPIHRHLEALCDTEWVGVSVDAGTPESYKQVKGADKFDQVINSIKALNEVAANGNSRLGLPGRGHGVSYKYLLRPETVGEIYDAAKIAKEIGCRSLHIRPIAPSWDKVNGHSDVFGKDDIYRFREQLEKARGLEDDNFGIYGITHKFNGDFSVGHDFNRCHATYMSAVLMPPTDRYKGSLDITTCCDNRGNDLFTQINLTSTEQIRDYWGSKEHKGLLEKIDVNKCARCTFDPHNKIYENVVEVDNMTPDFI